jgi:hypothetical protein
MIKKAVIVNTPTDKKRQQYLNVEFTDGTFVNLDEEELRRAWMMASGIARGDTLPNSTPPEGQDNA